MLLKIKKLKTIKLKTGILKVESNKILDNLVSFGSRINKKRGFFFVSKVTGKHMAVRPSKALETYKKLASLIPISDEPTLFIGFAEAATALGQGVFEQYNSKNSFYIHSSRFQTSKKILLSFQEEHSHAPSHIFYEPIDKDLRLMLKDITRIILVDDEISTGNTANNLIKELKKIFLDIKDYYVVTILDWTSKNYNSFKSLPLYKGNFLFKKDDKNIDIKIKSEPHHSEIKNLDEVIPYNFGKYGIKKLDIDISKYIDIEKLRDKKVLVLGTAEFMYIPYLLAKYIEDNGVDCYFQSTTRSPINIDGEITSKIEFVDNYFENIDNFLYNVIDNDYDNIIICYETTSLPKEFDLKSQLEKKFIVEEIFFEI